MVTIVNRGRFLKTVGWGAVGVGLYLITLGTTYDGDTVDSNKKDDNIIDAEFTIINE